MHINPSRFYNFFHVENSKIFKITSKCLSIFNEKVPASWVAHITKDFLACYSCSYYRGERNEWPKQIARQWQSVYTSKRNNKSNKVHIVLHIKYIGCYPLIVPCKRQNTSHVSIASFFPVFLWKRKTLIVFYKNENLAITYSIMKLARNACLKTRRP